MSVQLLVQETARPAASSAVNTRMEYVAIPTTRAIARWRSSCTSSVSMSFGPLAGSRVL